MSRALKVCIWVSLSSVNREDATHIAAEHGRTKLQMIVLLNVSMFKRVFQYHQGGTEGPLKYSSKNHPQVPVGALPMASKVMTDLFGGIARIAEMII